MEFKPIKSETVFQGRAFEVRQDQVQLPDGRQITLDIVDHRDAVTLLPVDGEGYLWFIRQYRHPAEQILLELPAGVMEAGEPAEESARRELREETGMDAGELRKLGSFYLAPGYSTECMHVFLASQLLHSPLPGDADEFLSIERIPVQEAFRMAENGQIRDAKSLGALLLARPHLSKYFEK